MKFLSFILILALAQPSQASLFGFGEAGHGDTQEICAYNQSSARVYKPQSVIDAENKLKAAEDKLEDLEKQYDRLNCSYCESIFSKVISAVDKNNYNEYIRHLEGGSMCANLFSNVDIYNYWSQFNNWEKISPYESSNKNKRNIAQELSGACQEEGVKGNPCGEPQDDSVLPRLPESPIPPAPTDQCSLKYAEPDGNVKTEICQDARAHLSASEYKKCSVCVAPVGSRSYGRCLKKAARLEEQILELEVEIEELEFELEDATADAEDSGEKEVCADCMKDSRSTFSKWLLPGLGAAVGVGVGVLVGKASRNAFEEKVASPSQEMLQ